MRYLIYLVMVSVVLTFSCCVTDNHRIENNFDESLMRIGTYSFGIGGALVFIGYSDYLIDRNEQNLKLASWGLALGILPLFVKMSIDENGNVTHQLGEHSIDVQNISILLTLSAIYGLHSLSRSPAVLAGALLGSTLALSNGTYSRDKGVAGMYCLSGALINILLPNNWDQNGVFLSNVALYLLVDQLYPKDSVGVEQKTSEGKHFSIKESRWLKD